MDAHPPTIAGPRFRGEIPPEIIKTENFCFSEKISLYNPGIYGIIFFAVEQLRVVSRCNFIFGPIAQLGERTVRIPMDAHRLTMAGPRFRGEKPPKLTKTQNLKSPLFVLKNGRKAVIWACSSAGRAFGSHPRGRRFDPVQVHHFEKNHRQIGGDFSFDHNNTTDGIKN